MPRHCVIFPDDLKENSAFETSETITLWLALYLRGSPQPHRHENLRTSRNKNM